MISGPLMLKAFNQPLSTTMDISTAKYHPLHLNEAAVYLLVIRSIVSIFYLRHFYSIIRRLLLLYVVFSYVRYICTPIYICHLDGRV
jgi:hypothetical protein